MKALTITFTNLVNYIFLSKEFDVKSKKIIFAIFKVMGVYFGAHFLLSVILK